MNSESGAVNEKYAKTLHLLQSGRLGEARSLLDELKNIVPEDPMIWIFSGFVSAALSQRGDAETSLKKAESLAEENPSAWFNMGIVYKRLDSSSRAKSMFSKAEKIDKRYKDRVKVAKNEDFPKLEIDVPQHLQGIYESITLTDSDAPKISSAPVLDTSERDKDWEIEEIRKKGRESIDAHIERRVEYVKKILKKKNVSSSDLEDALDTIEFACRLSSNSESAWAEKLLILLAMNRMTEAKEHFKKYDFHKRDLINYENWRFYTIQQYLNALELISESNNHKILPELYNAAAENIGNDIRVLADTDLQEPHLWFAVLIHAIKSQNQITAQKATEVISSIMIHDGKKMQQIIDVAKYLLDNKMAWLVINEEKSQFEIFWDWFNKSDTMKKNPSAYRGWAVLTRMFAQANQEDLAKFCYHMSRMVGESFEYRKGSLGESKIKRIPYDPKESATTSVMAAMNDAILSFGDGHPEYLPDLLEQDLAERKIPLPVGRLSETTVRCPRCREMFSSWRPLTTRTVSVQCPKCFKKIDDPYKYR